MKIKLTLLTGFLLCFQLYRAAGQVNPPRPVNQAPVTPPASRQNKAGARASAAEADEAKQGDMLIKINAEPKNAIFTGTDDIKFNLDLKNTYKQAQDGKLSVYVTTTFGTRVFENVQNVHIGQNSSDKLHITLPPQSTGFYQISFRFNLSFYDDTIKRIFGVNPTDIVGNKNKPTDFDDFWAGTRRQLDAIAPDFKETRDDKLSTPAKDVYLVEMHSWNNAVIRGWLTVPTKRRPKKIPVKYRLGGYIVAMKPTMDDDDFAVFNINVRGSGNSRDAIKYEGEYNLVNITSRDNYIYRGVYMDCIRGLDFVFAEGSKFGFDLDRVNVDGGSQGAGLGIVLAALDGRVKAVTSELPLYSDLRDAVRIGPLLYPEKKSPVWMFTDYMQKHPLFTSKKLFAVWDYYDPINFAPMVKCPVLMAISLLDELCPPYCSFAVFNQLATRESEKEYWINPILTHEVDNKYYGFQYYWVKEKFRLP